VVSWWKGGAWRRGPDETIVVAVRACAGLRDRADQQGHALGLLSRMAERVTFVLIPPLLLIFLVLGTIFLGIATPTEGGAMGAMGALIMAFAQAAPELRRCSSRR
jgi:TRAP-type mannitol/chloroaromatic compound transport system permease large subunit